MERAISATALQLTVTGQSTNTYVQFYTEISASGSATFGSNIGGINGGPNSGGSNIGRHTSTHGGWNVLVAELLAAAIMLVFRRSHCIIVGNMDTCIM